MGNYRIGKNRPTLTTRRARPSPIRDALYLRKAAKIRA